MHLMGLAGEDNRQFRLIPRRGSNRARTASFGNCPGRRVMRGFADRHDCHPQASKECAETDR